MKTNRSLWSRLMEVLAPAAPTVQPPTFEPRKMIQLDTPQPLSLAELRWA